MGKVIETNLGLTQDNEVISFQSRVLEYATWEGYVDLYKSGNSKMVSAELGGDGAVIPKGKILNLKIDRTKGYYYEIFRLSCDFELHDGTIVKRLAKYFETDL